MNKQTPHQWYRLVIFLLVLSLALVACDGGGGGNDGGVSDSQTQDDISALPADATDKGTIEYGQSVEDEITDKDEKHSYQFTGASGDNVLIRINTTGSAFSSPYAFLYGPDGALIANTDTSKVSRSARFNHTLEEDGTYTIIVRSFEGNGIDPYELAVEQE